MKIVQDNKSLEKLCKLLNKYKIIFLDTEFKRDNTYWPILCTIQIKTQRKEFLIDMLSGEKMNFENFRRILTSKKILKVIHSARQDIEVLNYALEISVVNVFDTQIAYNSIYGGQTIGYTSLVEKLFKIKLSKKHQVSDWTKRPLSSEQINYAINDVYYLPKIYVNLLQKIKKRNLVKRIKKIIEDHLDTKDVYNTKKSYKRIKIKNFSKNEKKLIKKFSEWRENYAQKDDLPRNWIVSDKNLIRASKNRLGELKKGKNKNDQRLEVFESYVKSLCLG